MLNKLVALVLVASVLVACSVAENSVDEDEGFMFMDSKTWPTDEDETAGLLGDDRIFALFCIETRDVIKNFLQSFANNPNRYVIGSLFSEGGISSQELIIAQEEAAAEGDEPIIIATELIKNNVFASTTTELANSKEEVRKNLKRSVKNLYRVSITNPTVLRVVHAAIKTACTQIFQSIALLRVSYDGDTLKDMINEACQTIQEDLLMKLKDMYSATENEISAAVAKVPSLAPQVMKVLSNAKPETVGCLTTRKYNVKGIVKFCNVFREAGKPLFPLLGM